MRNNATVSRRADKMQNAEAANDRGYRIAIDSSPGDHRSAILHSSRAAVAHLDPGGQDVNGPER